MAELKQALFLLIWLNENVLFHSTFSRHGRTRASSVLLIWLNENVPFHGTFSRHGITRASLALLIWLNENVENVVSKKLDGHRTPTEVHMYSDRGTHVPRPRYANVPTETGQTHQNYSDKNCNISNCKILIINVLDLLILDIFRIFIV